MPKKHKDLRYKAVSMLLRNKHIKKFQDIFKFIPFSVVATDMHTNNDRMKGLIKYPGRLNLKEIHKLADLFEYDFKKLLNLIEKSYDRE